MSALREAANKMLKMLEEASLADPALAAEIIYKIGAALPSLRAALAQEKAEPVAWMGAYDKTELYYRKPPQADVVPLYVAPPKAEPVQEPVEPVAWLAPDGSVRETPAAKSFGEWVWGPDDFRPLYTAPPQRKPLTEEKIDNICRQAHAGADPQEWARNFARAIERAHGIGETK